MKITINKFILGVMGIGIPSLLIGCGAQQDTEVLEETNGQQVQEVPLGEEEDTVQEEHQQLEINVVSMHGAKEKSQEELDEMIQKYEEENQEITVDYNAYVPTTIWKASIALDYVVNEGPDVLHFLANELVYPILDRNSMVSIEEIRAYDASFGKEVSEKAMESIQYTDGLHYALPTQGDYQVLFCNTDLFETYGIEVPMTEETFNQAIEQFGAMGITPIAAALGEHPDYWLEYALLKTYELENMENIGGNVTRETWEQALSTLKELSEQKAFSGETLTMSHQQAQQQFINKEAAMFLGSASELVEVMKEDETIKGYAVPINSPTNENKGYVSIHFSEGYYISREAWEDTDKKDVLLELTTNLVEKERAIREGEEINEGIHSINMEEQIQENIENAEEVNIRTTIRQYINQELWAYVVQQIPSIIKEERLPEEVVEEISYLNF